MRVKRFDYTMGQLRAQLYRQRLLIAVLCLSIVLLTICLATRREKTIILPPERSRYVLEDFSSEYTEGFVLLWIKNLLDFTPENYQQRVSILTKYASKAALEKLVEENDVVAKQQITQTFYPKSLAIEGHQAKSFGYLQRSSHGHVISTKEVEFTINFRQGPLGSPLLTDWSLKTLSRS